LTVSILENTSELNKGLKRKCEAIITPVSEKQQPITTREDLFLSMINNKLFPDNLYSMSILNELKSQESFTLKRDFDSVNLAPRRHEAINTMVGYINPICCM
jgi:hypothetical protein